MHGYLGGYRDCNMIPPGVSRASEERRGSTGHPLHSFNPFILFTGPDEVFGTHKIGLLVEIPDTVTLLLLRNLQGQIDALEARLDAIETP